MESYIIAYRKECGAIVPLDTGRTYAPIAARLRAEQLNATMQPELKALGGVAFVAFNVNQLESI